MTRRIPPRPRRPGEPVRYFSATCFSPRQFDLFGQAPGKPPERANKLSGLWRPPSKWRAPNKAHPGLGEMQND